MPSVVNELFKVTMSGSYVSQVWNNVFWYYNTTGVGNLNLPNVADSFDSEVTPDMAAAMNANVTLTNIRVAHVNGELADYNRTPSVTSGTNAGADCPPFIAAGIRLLRTTKETRNGYKRIVGMVEEDMTATTWLGGYQTLLSNLATAIEEALDMGGSLDNLDPVIVRTVTPTSWVYNPLAGTQIVARPTTQNSRKVGTGQ